MKRDSSAPAARLDALRPFIPLWLGNGRWLLAGFGLAVATAASGLGLLGVSGGFLAATALAAGNPQALAGFNMIMPTGWIRLFAVGRTVSRWAERTVTHDASFRIVGSLRVWLWERLSRQSPRQLGGWHAGELLSRFLRDIDNLDHLYLRVAVPGMAAAAGSAGRLFLCAWQTGRPASADFLALVAVFLAALAGVPYLAWRLGSRLGGQRLALQASVRTGLIDLIDALEELGLHRAAWDRQCRDLAVTDRRRLELESRVAARTAVLRGFSQVLVAAAVLGFFGLAAGSGPGHPGGAWLVALAAMCLGSADFLPQLALAWHELALTAASAGRLRDLAGRAPDPAWRDSGPEPAGTDLSIAGLSFAYGAEPAILKDLCLEIPAGCHLALQGESGSGKSTLLALLARLADPAVGSIRLGGVDLRELDETSLRRRIALAPQEPWIFTATLGENLRLGRADADDGRLWAVLDLVGLADAVRTWPRGLDTWLDEEGASLSGGQRRKLGLARALLRDAPVLLADEPTEGLDDGEAGELIRRLRLALAGRTLVWVSHRPTGLDGFDRVWRLVPGGTLQEHAKPGMA